MITSTSENMQSAPPQTQGGSDAGIGAGAEGAPRTETAAAAKISPEQRTGVELLPAWRRHGLGLMMAVATLAVLSWGLARPALWIDESATLSAVQRTWPDLGTLIRSPEAPLVPFYALLKVLTGATSQILPHSPQHQEVFLRWPSVAVGVIGVWVLTVWLAKFCPTPVVLGTGVFLITATGFSRYGQEARPYATVMLFAITSTVLWTRLVLDTRPGKRWLWTACYAVSVILMICANSISVVLIAAHVVASLVALDRGRRIQALARTVVAATIGVVLVSPVAFVMVLHGRGASKYPPLTVHVVTSTLTALVTAGTGTGRILGIGALLPLAFLGLTRMFDAKYRFLTRLAASWALVPLIAWICAVALRPNLLISRYVLFVLPGWAILAGIGTVTLFELFKSVMRLVTGAGYWELGVAWALTFVLLGALAISQLPSMQGVRGPAGHGDDIRPVIALADSPRYRNLPIMSSARTSGIEINSYGRQDERRLIGMQMQHDQNFIWPSMLPHDVRRFQLRTAPRLILLMRTDTSGDCSAAAIGRDTGRATPCLPAFLVAMNYHVVTMKATKGKWTFVELYRGGQPPATQAQQVAASPFQAGSRS